MTPAQKKLARHALGLPNYRGVSYRNRYVAAYCPGPYDDWMRMVDARLADCHPLRKKSNRRFFYLTLTGAQAALEPGEKLCPEDFPDQLVPEPRE